MDRKAADLARLDGLFDSNVNLITHIPSRIKLRVVCAAVNCPSYQHAPRPRCGTIHRNLQVLRGHGDRLERLRPFNTDERRVEMDRLVAIRSEILGDITHGYLSIPLFPASNHSPHDVF